MKDALTLFALAAGLSARSPYRRERLPSIYPPEPGQGRRKAKAKARVSATAADNAPNAMKALQ